MRSVPLGEEVRDFFHYCDNYIDAVDRAGRNSSRRPSGHWVRISPYTRATATLAGDRSNQSKRSSPAAHCWIAAVLRLAPSLTPASGIHGESRPRWASRTPRRRINCCIRFALLDANRPAGCDAGPARFQSDENLARIAKYGLANNYFAGAALLPTYRRFVSVRAKAAANDPGNAGRPVRRVNGAGGAPLSTLAAPRCP